MAITHPKPIPQFTEKQIESLWSRIDKRGPDECWLWQRSTLKGSGRVNFFRKDYLVHRIVLALKTGTDSGLLAMHLCDNPLCCNPNHLSWGTPAQNTADRDAKGRTARGEKSGSKTHPEKTRKGSCHHKAKLNESIVREIRSLLDQGENPNEIAHRFGVTHGTIWFIAKRMTWRHI